MTGPQSCSDSTLFGAIVVARRWYLLGVGVIHYFVNSSFERRAECPEKRVRAEKKWEFQIFPSHLTCLTHITEKYVKSVSSQAATGQCAEGGNNESGTGRVGSGNNHCF